MTYGEDGIQARRRTVYVSPKTYRLSKAAAKDCGMTWSEYVEGCIAQQLVKETAQLAQKKPAKA